MTEPDENRRRDDVPGNRRAEDKVLEVVSGIRETLNKEHAENRSDIAEIKRDLKRVLNGFPGGDPESHRQYHQNVIDSIANRNAIIREILTKAVGAGSIVGLGWVCIALWEYFKSAVSK